MEPSPDTRTRDTTRHVRLAPGTLVRARGDGMLQVGTDPRRRALLPDTVTVRGLVHLLEQGVRLAGPELPPVAESLRRAGVLQEPAVGELLRQARACLRVHLDAPAPVRERLLSLLRTAGMGEACDGEVDADVLVRVSLGPGDSAPAIGENGSERAVLDVALVDGRFRLGPFSVPGRTACAGCIRAHDLDQDPWAVSAVVPDRATASDRDGLAAFEDADPLVVESVLMAAVRDVVAWAEGREPSTWSATRWSETGELSERHVWARHPHCGCSWDDDL